MRVEKHVVAALVGLALVALPGRAEAYCRTTTCTPSTCVPSASCPSCMEGGLPLYWPGGCASFSVNALGSVKRNISAQVTKDLISQALARWMGVDCGGGTPSLKFYTSDYVKCSEQEYNQESPNANIWMYRDDFWPYASSSATLALTTVTYNVKTGEIFDADVELNTADNQITVGDVNVAYDLDSIITHESGHFLGLAHSCDSDATMFYSYVAADTKLRTLEADDIAGVCAIYPPGKDVNACDPTPRHGFSTECGSEVDDKGCCTTAPGGPSRSGTAAVVALLAAVGLGAARKRRKRRS